MATLNDLLENFGLGNEDDVGGEKVASDNATEDEQALLEALLYGENEKTASEGDTQMGSLADLYMQMTAHDEEYVDEHDDFDKIASYAVEEEVGVEKLAAEYDAAGRIMARGFYDEFNKLARDLEEGSQSSMAALGPRGTDWQMETNMADKGPLQVKGSTTMNSDALKGGGDLGAQSAMGAQFTTAKKLLTNRARQTGAK